MTDPPTDEQSPEHGGEPLIPTHLPPQDDDLFSVYGAFGEIRDLPPEERSHWDVRLWERR